MVRKGEGEERRGEGDGERGVGMVRRRERGGGGMVRRKGGRREREGRREGVRVVLSREVVPSNKAAHIQPLPQNVMVLLFNRPVSWAGLGRKGGVSPFCSWLSARLGNSSSLLSRDMRSSRSFWIDCFSLF